MLRKPCRLQTDGRTDGQTDGQGESSIPPSNFVGLGYNKGNTIAPHYCPIVIPLTGGFPSQMASDAESVSLL